MFDRGARLLGVEVVKARSVGPTLQRLWAYFRRYRPRLILAAALILLSTAMTVAVPVLIGRAVDCYLTPLAIQGVGTANCLFLGDGVPQPGDLWRGLGFMILLITALYVTSAVFVGMTFYQMSVAGYHVLRDIRHDVFLHIHRLTLGYFGRHEAGDVMSRFTNDTDTMQQIIGFGLVQVFSGGLLILFIVVAMFSQNVPFALISLITLPLMFWITQWLSAQARRAFRQARKEIGAVNADLQESISGVREVQAFGREAENIEQFELVNAANRDANIKAQAYSSALAPALEALSYVNIAIVAGVGGLALLSGGAIAGTAVTLGVIITFIGFAQQFNRPVQQIALLWTNLQSAVAGGERIFDLLDEVPDMTDAPGAPDMPAIVGHVQYEGIHAAYNPGETVLRGIDIDAKPGTTVAIVGPTGAGKTTIINLLPRFWDPTRGTVRIDGIDIRSVTRRSLRRQIGIVLQDTYLFSDTVANNIRYGRPEANDEEVVAAAKLAHADAFIQKMEHGYETVLGERGAGLSQGQRQLLAIARVALLNPRILILDEATSSVDTRTEREIQTALEALLAGRTSFVIAHRLSTIRNADELLVLDAGQILERGTHDDLLAAGGFYYDLYMSQFRRETADVAAEQSPTEGP